ILCSNFLNLARLGRVYTGRTAHGAGLSAGEACRLHKRSPMISSPNSSLDASVLVLNKLFMAIHIISVRRAFCLLCKDLAEVVSLDHVIPRSQGGHSTWDNIVCACVSCNVRKGGRTPKEAHLSLIRKPEKPKRSPLLNLKLTHRKYQSWKTFLENAYWSVELK